MNENQRSIIWGFVDGSISISGSMLLAVLISACQSCGGIWPLAFLKELSEKNTGLVVVATLLLFPTAVAVYGGLKMWFAAKEAVEKKAMAKGRVEGRAAGRAEGIEEGREKGMAEGREKGIEEGREKGIEEGLEKGRAEGQQGGRQYERERIGLALAQELAQLGISMPAESITRILIGQPAAPPQTPPPPRPYRRRSRRNGNGK